MTFLLREILQKFGESLARKRVHHPGDAYTDHQEHQQRPQDVLDAIAGGAPAQECKRGGNNQREQKQRREMAQLKTHYARLCGPARLRMRGAPLPG